MTDQAMVQVAWGPRAETPEALAARIVDLLDELAPFLEFVDAPLGVLTDGELDTDLDESRLASALEAGVRTDDRGAVWEGCGYTLTLFAVDDERREVTVNIAGGATAPVKRVALNSVTLRVEDSFPDDVFRGFGESILVGLVDAFEPAYGWATERVQREVNQRSGVRPRFGPVSWVGDALGAFPDDIAGAEQHRHGPGTLIRVVPEGDVNIWTDPEPTRRVVAGIDAAGWSPSLTDLSATD